MKWGLVPSFTKKTDKPDHYRMFNARSESLKEKPSFRRLIPNNRCLVAVEGFYEWKKDGSKKQPYYIHFKDGRPLVFAALYDSWQNSEGEILYTFTILTTRSSPALEWLHDRMPVIFGSKGTTEMWLSDSQPKLETALSPYADSDLVWYPVTPAMGKPSFDGPECIKEIPLKTAVKNQISKLFSRKTDDNIDKFEPIDKCKSEPDVFHKNVEPNNLKIEPATEDTVDLADEKNVFREEFHSIKREFKELAPNLEIETEVPERYSTSAKKKPQTGDKQISLLSYFGKK
ncbi:hypothetical protein KSP39_PZI015869 [Platanthera zijinensis]|uniref:Embryonic stem cell-specific 5-hydroxymethylcytosine-binding protein n=1 Tax=Platanthera zijinensis TaxID=2320716 RepID=A0AAP0B7T7_9ASPA